jgi:CBS domain-containing protein
MLPQDQKPRSSQQLMDALDAARDGVRLQLHLLSLEAKQRWHELEENLVELRGKLEHGGDRIADSVAVTVRDLTHSVQELLHQAGAIELTTPVKKLMSTTAVACSPGDPLSRAAQIMWDTDCGAVPVVGPDGRLVGIVTDRDVCMAAYTRGEPLAAISVESTMARDVCTASPDDTLGHVARLMGERQVHRIPVTEGGRLVGIVALADLARHVRSGEGNNLPGCVILAHTIGRISAGRAEVATRAAAE